MKLWFSFRSEKQHVASKTHWQSFCYVNQRQRERERTCNEYKFTHANFNQTSLNKMLFEKYGNNGWLHTQANRTMKHSNGTKSVPINFKWANSMCFFSQSSFLTYNQINSPSWHWRHQSITSPCLLWYCSSIVTYSIYAFVEIYIYFFRLFMSLIDLNCIKYYTPVFLSVQWNTFIWIRYFLCWHCFECMCINVRLCMCVCECEGNISQTCYRRAAVCCAMWTKRFAILSWSNNRRCQASITSCETKQTNRMILARVSAFHCLCMVQIVRSITIIQTT